MLSQRKIELAVLYKLDLFAEEKGDRPTPGMVSGSFKDVQISLRRVEVTLDELFVRGEAESYPDPQFGFYRWQITRAGFEVVDRALRVPTTFIARLAKNGDAWLESSEAEKAILKKLPDREGTARPEPAQPGGPGTTPPIHITNTFAPQNSNDLTLRAGKPPIQWATWTNALVALLVGAGVIVATLWAQGKI